MSIYDIKDNKIINKQRWREIWKNYIQIYTNYIQFKKH